MKHSSVALLLFALTLAGHAAPQPAAARRASVENGKAMYLRSGCHACHGTMGHGGAATRLAPEPLPFDAFARWVRSGTPGWGFISGMPAFPPALLTDAELEDVHAYLASIPKPPSADSLPLLKL